MATVISKSTQEFGRRVRAARSEAGFTQEKFAAACGVDRSFMGVIERGETNATLTTILRVTKALGIEPGALLDGL